MRLCHEEHIKMKIRIIFTLNILLTISTLSAQEVRTYDGTNNNLNNPKWGATFTQLERLVPATYSDKVSAPAGVQRQNPRKISNALFAQNTPLFDSLGLSDFIWVFGQFIDHDITLSEGSNEPAMIPVNFPDPHFNPGGTFENVMIPMSRTKAMEGTGTDENNPREHFNEITAWLDASAVYGSDAFRAGWLRTYKDGKLKTSAGNLLPYNTLSGEFNDEIDIDAPFMADDVKFAPRLFVAGDIRANENVLLLTLHTLFAREHNRICDELKVQHPDWEDEQIYQHARKIVGGLLQAITFEEWLPAMGVHLAPYSGYQPDANPGIFNGFSAAAFRMGHTLLSGNIMVIDKEGNERAEGPLKLRNAFFNPGALVDNGGLDPFIRGMAAQVQQLLDSKIVDDVRNFLFGAPGSGAGGLDLAAININRGRERGLPDLNTYREALGLPLHQSFKDICKEEAVIEALQSNYTSVDDIDAWVGMLAESHMPSAIFGETVMAFMQRQFTAIRDGDRFYYEIDPNLTEEEKASIRSTTMRDVVMRNTDIKIMQDNVFEAIFPHDICGFYGPEAALRGVVINEFGTIVLNVDVEVIDNSDELLARTTAHGSFSVDNIATCQDINVKLAKNDNFNNGITTLDMVLILKHILNIAPFDSPYKYIAADVNRTNSISVADLVEIRKLILGTTSSFPNNTSWRFIDADYNFLDNNPLDEDIPEIFSINLSKDLDLNILAIKTGDVNGTADHTSQSNGLLAASDRTLDKLVFTGTDITLQAGQTYDLSFSASSDASIIGYQFALGFDTNAIEPLSGLSSKTLTEHNYSLEDQSLRVSWNEIEAQEAGALEFGFKFRALQDGQLSRFVSMQPDLVHAEAYNSDLEVLPVEFLFTDSGADQFELGQNQPNPFRDHTTIGFKLPKSSFVQLRVFDAGGKQLYQMGGDYTKGFHALVLEAKNLPSNGVLYYQLTSRFGSLTKKMILID